MQFVADSMFEAVDKCMYDGLLPRMPFEIKLQIPVVGFDDD